MTTVLMVSGSWPPQACGVGDYTERLCRELEDNGISVVRFADDRLSQLYSPGAVRRATEANCDVVHIQYPTAGYGRSFIPAALPATVRNKPVVVTLHEYSVFRWYRRNWFSPYARRCAARVFTTDEERQLFERRFPDRSGADHTIEIASNIPVALGAEKSPHRVSYFGLIAPNKGIEAFLDLCEVAKAAGSGLTFDMIGAVPERHQRYADDILRLAAACNVNIFTNLPDEETAQRLATATYAYLPFPDGASGKRGTLAAAIVNKLIVITQHSGITPEWIRSTTFDAKRPEEALTLLIRLQVDTTFRETAAKKGGLAAARFRWDTIAHRHENLYDSLLSEKVRDVSDVAVSYESRMAS
jgi:glycosyltransferase involved in cell wall biosynthesis